MVAGCLVSLALLPEDTTELAFHLLMAGLGFSLGAVYLVPVAMLMLLAVGQAAVFGPAKRASSVPPAVATRTI